MRSDLPSGTVTFLFTDVEGSTRLLHELGAEGYAEALAEHRSVIRAACAAEGGVEVDTQGDAFFFAFPTAPGALAAASAFTQVLASGPVHVRVGLHTGTPLLTEEGYVGDDVHFAARVAASGHGGQVACSAATAELVELPLTDLGEHRLKDVAEAVVIFQLGDRAFPPLKTISNTNLPRPASSFVGREAEVEAVRSRIDNGARLVTLTGPGGSGKTRLAIETAATLVPEYKAGVFWIGLATLRDPALVTETIAQTLGAKDGLAEHVGERELLLLLDNLEQVVAAAPELAALLERCPNLTLLVTSRELLRVFGEVEYAVPPLVEPEAIALFCERAQLEPSEEIAELCARLDNLPLAVELAAARAKALSPRQILDRLSKRLDLLKGGRDADPRQQTLRATIEWSYDLLSPEEQRLFARLSVFAGGSTLEAAEEVADADLDTLQSLVEKSLVRFTDERYWMLETIREYAGEAFEQSGERGSFEKRHAAYMVDRYGRMPRQGPEWVEPLEAERDNLRSAMAWTLRRGDAEQALVLATAYGALCRLQGPFGEAVRWLDDALGLEPEASPEPRWAALYAAGSLATVNGDLDYAEVRLEEALQLAGTIGNAENAARALRGLGIVAGDRGDLERSEELQREALDVFLESGNDDEVRQSLGLLAFIAIIRRDWPRARAALEDALERSQAAGDTRQVYRQIGNLGYVLVREGRFREALEPLMKSVEMAHEHLDTFGLASQLEDLAGAALGLGKPVDAAVMVGGTESLYDRTGRPATPTFDEWRQEIRSALRDGLEGHVLSECSQRGRGMEPDELVAYAKAFVDSAA